LYTKEFFETNLGSAREHHEVQHDGVNEVGAVAEPRQGHPKRVPEESIEGGRVTAEAQRGNYCDSDAPVHDHKSTYVCVRAIAKQEVCVKKIQNLGYEDRTLEKDAW